MKKLVILIMCLALLLGCATVLCACGEDDDGIFKFTLNDDGESYNVVAKEGATIPGELTIPNTYNGKPVTVIGKFAFQGKKDIYDLIIPEGIVKIDVQAFNGCTGLNRVTYPSSLKTIGQMSFANCANLGTIDIPDTVTELGIGAFDGCTTAGSIEIGSGISEINEGTFAHCQYVATVTIPGNVKRIKMSAFSSCKNLSSVYMQDGLEVIEADAFSFCDNLSFVNIPASVTSVGDMHSGPFSVSPVTVLEAPASICRDLRLNDREELIAVSIIGTGEVEEMAFMGCTGIIGLTIAEGVTAIGQSAFCDCAVPDLVLPDGLLTIGSTAFGSGVNTVILPSSINSIGDNAFDLLESVYYKGTPAQWEQVEKRGYFACNQLCFYSATQPLTNDGNIYWHYVNDMPVIWPPVPM